MLTHWKRPWCWERLKVGGKGDDRGWDGWMALLTQWPWVWGNYRRKWRTGKLDMLQFMESQTVGHVLVTEQQEILFEHKNEDVCFMNYLFLIQCVNYFFSLTCIEHQLISVHKVLSLLPICIVTHCSNVPWKWKWSHSVVSNSLWPPWTVAHQAPPSMGFSRQEYCSGLPFPSPGESSQPRDQTLVSHIAGRRFNLWATREAPNVP